MDDSKLLENFGEHVKKLRKQKALSQEKLALKAGLDRTYISGVERGKRNISILNIYKIATTLEIPVIEMFMFEVNGNG